jgi:hypothetical protein
MEGEEAGRTPLGRRRVRQGESFEGAIVVKREAKKFGGDRVGFGVIEEGESGDEEVKVFAMVMFDTKVIHHQRKDNAAAKETGGRGLVKAVGSKMGEKTVLGQLAGLL